jgi:hypothetical protein
VPDSVPGKRDAGRWLVYGTELPSIPEVGAVCGKAARTDLGGGREVTRVPTASGTWRARYLLHLLTAGLGTRERRRVHFGGVCLLRRCGPAGRRVVAPQTAAFDPEPT